MVIDSQIVPRQALPNDLQQLANLIHFEAYVHRHLDYRPPLDWIDQRPFLVLEKGNQIAATLACPVDPPQVAWIRLFASSSNLLGRTAWEILWPGAIAHLEENHPPRWAAAIPMHNWLTALLKKSGFEETHQIVMLCWERTKRLKSPSKIPCIVRPMTPSDLVSVKEIDESSFVPVWQNSLACLEFAFRQSVVATVAEKEGKLVGYQISTATSVGGHLARLAVYPHLQGKGIGYALVYDLLTQFLQRGGRMLTVNTQKNNLTSLALYKKAGFVLTGEEYPIYQYTFSGSY